MLVNEKDSHLIKSKFLIPILKNYQKYHVQMLTLKYFHLTSRKICHIPTFLVGTCFIKDNFDRIHFVYILLKYILLIFSCMMSLKPKKRQNEVNSFISHYFENVLNKDVKIFYLFSDNCSSQNKNHALVQFMYSIIQTENMAWKLRSKDFQNLDTVSFYVIDVSAKLKKRRKIDKVFLPQIYKNMVKETCPEKYHVINVTQNILYTFSEYLKPFLKKYFISSNKSKFTIMSYRIMQYTKDWLFSTYNTKF